jgi:hypothetical protein
MSKFKKGDKVMIRPDSEYYRGQNFRKGEVIMRTITSIADNTGLNHHTDHNVYNEKDLEFYRDDASSTRKFKVGDAIIGNSTATYNVTKEGWIGVVTKLLTDNIIEARNFTPNDPKDSSYTLREEAFDLHTVAKFKKGNIVRALVDSPRALAALCSKGDLLRVDDVYGTTSFSSDMCRGEAHYWSGMHTEDFELTSLTSTEPAVKKPDISYKFAVGDTVKIVANGWGVGERALGKTTTITELGLYCGPGYKCSLGFGNCAHGSHGFVGEKSFELISPESIKESSYKFDIGDIVRIIRSGHGIANSDEGQEVTIIEQGMYQNKELGYRIDPPFGNSKDGKFKYMCGETSFELVSRPIKSPSFKARDILEFIRKDPIGTCFEIGDHVTFLKYEGDTVKAKGIMSTSDCITTQNARIHQFKFVRSAKDVPKAILTSFPTEGWCLNANMSLGIFLRDKFEVGSSPKPSGSSGYAWNSHSYWAIATFSGKPKYDWEDLKQFVKAASELKIIASSSKSTPLKYKLDDKLVIKYRLHGNMFEIGTVVQVVEINAKYINCPYRVVSVSSEGDSDWWVNDDEVDFYGDKVPDYPLKYSKGDKVVITGNTNDHGFGIGDVVKITSVHLPSNSYTAQSGKGTHWSIKDAEVEPYLQPGVGMREQITSGGRGYGKTAKAATDEYLREHPRVSSDCESDVSSSTIQGKWPVDPPIYLKGTDPYRPMGVSAEEATRRSCMEFVGMGQSAHLAHMREHPMMPSDVFKMHFGMSERNSKLEVKVKDDSLKSRIVKTSPLIKRVTKLKGLIVPLKSIKSRIK